MANFLLSFLRKYLVLCKKSTVVNMLAMSVVKGMKHWFGVCWSVLWLMRQWHMDTVWVINVVGKNPACNQHTFWTCWLRDKPSVLYLQWLDAVGWAAVKNWVVGCWHGYLTGAREMQTYLRPRWWHCHSLSLVSVKSRLVLPFQYRLTWVVAEKGPLNRCVWLRAKKHIMEALCSLVKQIFSSNQFCYYTSQLVMQTKDRETWGHLNDSNPGFKLPRTVVWKIQLIHGERVPCKMPVWNEARAYTTHTLQRSTWSRACWNTESGLVTSSFCRQTVHTWDTGTGEASASAATSTQTCTTPTYMHQWEPGYCNVVILFYQSLGHIAMQNIRCGLMLQMQLSLCVSVGNIC